MRACIAHGEGVPSIFTEDLWITEKQETRMRPHGSANRDLYRVRGVFSDRRHKSGAGRSEFKWLEGKNIGMVIGAAVTVAPLFTGAALRTKKR
jgi:hypothetical protein